MAWFDDEEVYRHRSYDFRRRKHKFWLWFLVIIIVLVVVYAYNIGGIKTSVNNIASKTAILSSNNLNSFGYASIKDINQNPTNYIGKKVSINGELSPTPEFVTQGIYKLSNKDGYWVAIFGNCLEPNREYDYDHDIAYGSTKYTATGIITSDGKLSCTSPIK